MNFVENLNQYNENNIFFCEPIKNTIMLDSTFIRILYSPKNMTLNGIYLLLVFDNIITEKHFNKNKYIFNSTNHKELIDKIKIIEEDILKKSEIYDKIPQFKIYEQLISGNIKLFSDSFLSNNNNSFILKISGIWKNNYNYGLTYKYTKINLS